MRKIDRYIFRKIFSVFIVTLFFCIIMMALFDLFQNLQKYTNSNLQTSMIIRLTLLTIPSSIALTSSAALLFSATYFFSSLSANNELIFLFNTGYSFKRLIFPALICSLFIASLLFLNSEFLLRKTEAQRTQLNQNIYGSNSWSKDNSNISLLSEDKKSIIFTRNYFDNNKKLSDIKAILLDDERNLETLIISDNAIFDDEKGWKFFNANIYNFKEDLPKYEALDEYENERLNFSPSLYKNLSSDIQSMSISQAFEYLDRIKVLDTQQYALFSTQIYDRLFSGLSVFIMMIIATLFPYKFKKNILLFSIIFSLAIAVVYYVIKMLSIILAKQGAISALSGVFAPMIIIIVLMMMVNLIVNRIF